MTIGKVTIKGGFLLLMAVLIYFDTSGVIIWMIPAAALHEAGHWLALRLFGMREEAWEFSLRGVEMRLPAWPALSYGRDFIATMAGPLCSLLAALLAAKLALSQGSGLHALSGMAFTQGMFNLLPARSLDGGRLLRLAVARFRGEHAADRVLGISTAACAVLLTAGGVWVFVVSRQNFAVMLTALYLAAGMLPWGERKNRYQLADNR